MRFMRGFKAIQELRSPSLFNFKQFMWHAVEKKMCTKFGRQ